jgi:glycogen synthase
MTLETLQIGMEWFEENPGGLTRVYGRLLSELALQDVRSFGLVAGSGDVTRMSNGLAHSFAPADSPLLTRLRAVRSAAAPWLGRHGPESVVVSHFALYALSLLDRVRNRPFVVHFQGPWGDESRAEGASAISAMARTMSERLVYRRADAAIVLSTAFRDILTSRFGVDAERVHVIPGGVEAGRFAHDTPRAECRQSLGWALDRPIVLCVRRLVRRVGIDTLVEAAVDVKRRVPTALILIAGTGPLREELEVRIRTLALSDTVRLLGFVRDEDLPLAYRAADLTVVPTASLEGFGLITVESLASGTPCLVTPVGGLSEVVTPLAPQLVMRSTAASAIADAISSALLGELPLPSSEACAAYARTNFDWPVIARRVRDVYAGTTR